jgi:microcystin-dependent protein
MSDQYIGELRIFSFRFAPTGWALCNGQLLPINQYQALFSILGTTYGGDGIRNFALPELRGRVPISFGNGYAIGQKGGEEGHVLTTAEIAAHTHTMRAKAARADVTPVGRQPGGSVVPAEGVTGTSQSPIPVSIYSSSTSPDLTFDPGAIANAGGSPHENRQPFLTLNVCIALTGVFPSRN